MSVGSIAALASSSGLDFGWLAVFLGVFSVAAGILAIATLALVVASLAAKGDARAARMRLAKHCAVIPLLWVVGFVLLVIRG